tara:strand:+ start:373 stop:786 length:414 start_codon:yes stop_codon:yes gene_type:complete
MKKLILINLLLITTLSFAQSKIATTEDGKKVILKDDNTWEYAKSETKFENSCVVEADFKEPKWNSSGTWKKMGTRVDDLKKHISVDLGVDENKIILLQLSEQLGNAVYVLCVDGNKMKYRRTGSVFRKDGEDVLKMD